MPITWRIILTGGPGAGKTTVLRELASRGHHCKGDSARHIIQERVRMGLSRRPEPVEFARQILAADVQQYIESPPNKPVFFDRGVPDALGMLHQLGELPEADLARYLRDYPYSPTVFIFPPWEDIFHPDTERDQKYEEAVRVFEAIRLWYCRIGFTLVEVPRMPVAERCEFLLSYR